MAFIFVIGLLVLTSYGVFSFRLNRITNVPSKSQLIILQGSGKPVEVTFQPSGKVVMAEQGDKIEDIAKKNGVTIPFKCKQVLIERLVE